NRNVNRSMRGIKKRVTLRLGNWIMVLAARHFASEVYVSRPKHDEFDRVRRTRNVNLLGESSVAPLGRVLGMCPGRSAQLQNQVAADEDDPSGQDVDQGHEQPAARGGDGRSIKLDDTLRGSGARLGQVAESLKDAGNSADQPQHRKPFRSL